MSVTLEIVARHIGANVEGFSEIRGTLDISGINSPAHATSSEITFVTSEKYIDDLRESRAAAVIVPRDTNLDINIPKISHENPYLAYAQLTALFTEKSSKMGIHPSASVATTATLAEDVYIYPNVSIYHDIMIGSDCIIHSGSVVGADGFGFAPTREGWLKIHQLGRVQIGNNVELGANSAIDRGALQDTIIGDGVKIDNMVHVGHNVSIGSGTAMAAQVGISGSTTVGKNCMLGGQVGVVGHLSISDNVQVTGKGHITNSVTEPGIYSSGTSLTEARTWRKNVARFKKLDGYPMLMVDRVLEIQDGESIRCLKNVSYCEEVFQGHFPDNPILPGVVIIEALAQASGILGFKTVGKTPEDGLLYLFAGIEDVRFKRRVIPGDQLILESKIVASKRHIWKFSVTAKVNDEVAVSGLLTCAITEN